MNAFTEFRNVTISYGGSQPAMPIDAYKAVVRQVEEWEKKVSMGVAPDNLTAVNVAITGTQRYKTHVFSVTTTFASGTYVFDWVETVPTVDDIS